MTDIQLIVTSVIGVLTILGGIYTALQARRANRESAVVSGYDTLVEHLQGETASRAATIKELSARIVHLERRDDLFTRWGRAVIGWYESIHLPEPIPPLPKPHPVLGINGEDK